MIRKNASLNCQCIDGVGCANGVGYCDETCEGKPRCRKIGKVKPVDMSELEKSIQVDVIIASIGNPLPVEMVVRENRTARTLELFDDTYTTSTESRGDKWDNLNSDDRIDDLLVMSDCIRDVTLLPLRKPILDNVKAGAIFALYPVLSMTREVYQDRVVRECSRLEDLHARLGISHNRIEIPDAFLACDIPEHDYTGDDNESFYLYFESAL